MNTLAMLATRVIIWTADPSPTPSAPPDDQVTPGLIGFGLTFFVAAATILLIVDMSRRMRRVRYRSEIREQLETERLAESAKPAKSASPTKPAAPTKSTGPTNSTRPTKSTGPTTSAGPTKPKNG